VTKIGKETWNLLLFNLIKLRERASLIHSEGDHAVHPRTKKKKREGMRPDRFDDQARPLEERREELQGQREEKSSYCQGEITLIFEGIYFTPGSTWEDKVEPTRGGEKEGFGRWDERRKGVSSTPLHSQIVRSGNKTGGTYRSNEEEKRKNGSC